MPPAATAAESTELGVRVATDGPAHASQAKHTHQARLSVKDIIGSCANCLAERPPIRKELGFVNAPPSNQRFDGPPDRDQRQPGRRLLPHLHGPESTECGQV